MRATPYLILLALFFLTLSGCSTTKSKAYVNQRGVVSPTVSAMLQANTAEVPFPVYSSYSEVEPFLRQQDGITYVVNFWATWCRPCIREMEHFQQLAEATNRDDVQIILISLDKAENVPTKMKDFVAERKLGIPVVAFTDNFYDGWIYKVDNAWQRSSIPVTLIYRNGKRHFNKGQISSYQELEGLVARVR